MLKVNVTYKSYSDCEIPEILINIHETETDQNINIYPHSKEDMFSLVEALSRVIGKITVSIEN